MYMCRDSETTEQESLGSITCEADVMFVLENVSELSYTFKLRRTGNKGGERISRVQYLLQVSSHPQLYRAKQP